MSITLNFREGVGTITKLVSKLADQTSTPLVLIDGRAGAGKSSFAKSLQDELFLDLEVAPKLVSMEDLYPGWEGLAEGSRYLEHQILKPLSSGRDALWQVWDWDNGVRGRVGEPGNGWRSFVGGTPLIVEGCGSLSKTTYKLASLRIWLESPPETRRQRYSQRDSGKFDQNWSMWSTQEDDFYQDHQSARLADYLIMN